MQDGIYSDDEILDSFIEDTQELVTALEADLLSLEKTPQDQGLINSLFRSYHTLKGGAGMVGMTSFSDYAHKVENLLSQVRDGVIPITPEMISLFLESIDCLNAFILEMKGEGDVDSSLIEQNIQRIQNISKDTTIPSIVKSTEQLSPSISTTRQGFRIRFSLRGDFTKKAEKLKEMIEALQSCGDLNISEGLLDSGQGELELLSSNDQLMITNLVEFFLDEEDFQFLPGTKDENEPQASVSKPLGTILVEEHLLSADDLQEALQRQKPLGQILVEQGKIKAQDLEKALHIKAEQENVVSAGKRAKTASSIRVDISKLDKLLNLVGEATIHQAHFSQISSQLERIREIQEGLTQLLGEKNQQVDDFQEKMLNLIDETEEGLQQIMKSGERIMLDLQDQVMSLRMLPIRGLFASFQRMVRDYSSRSGKKIILELYGEDTELDKTLIEQLNNPLKHMIRNAMDHGLELPEVREASGKNARGTIRLGAAHREGHIVIEIKDDGMGLNAQKILEKGRQQGLVKQDEDLTEEQIFGLLFRAGFSTAEKVTDLSGRGVGLDVVRQDIESLRGVVEITSIVGAGTTFLIKLPLTLAIIDGMLVDIGEQRFIIPLLSVVESLRPLPNQVKKVKNQGELIEVRGEYLPLVRLHRLLRLQPKFEDPTQALVVIVEEGGQKSCLLVDEAIDQQQAVIKSLEENFYEREGIAGATVLGDGRVSLILDVPGVLRQAARLLQ
ncbi:MAG: chemotaxis protein CheA [SAR324 cluster bacterium]|uniref:Chemotaxis protein CheA n=1 Tax=SAR324 cluster bacterium TaxID=2024889 RepID=A0A2A4SNV4_9DELT|nr:MAG: chemotaxis protein CheA [SAR324 cluster bacterium]